MERQMDVEPLLDHPERRRRWLLSKALESASLDDAVKWARAAEDFIDGADLTFDASFVRGTSALSVPAPEETDAAEQHKIVGHHSKDQIDDPRDDLATSDKLAVPSVGQLPILPVANGLSGWSGVGALSPREVEILKCLLCGSSNKVIARQLGIVEATVKTHLKSLMRKIRAGNRTKAALWALSNGLEPCQNYG
jgi:DNA-binding CsgD family transcriptional regulator